MNFIYLLSFNSASRIILCRRGYIRRSGHYTPCRSCKCRIYIRLCLNRSPRRWCTAVCSRSRNSRCSRRYLLQKSFARPACTRCACPRRDKNTFLDKNAGKERDNDVTWLLPDQPKSHLHMPHSLTPCSQCELSTFLQSQPHKISTSIRTSDASDANASSITTVCL